MTSSKWTYPAEKFGTARRILMAPHPNGEARSFLGALHECAHGLKDVHAADLDDSARSWMEIITAALDTTGVDDPERRGTLVIKTENLSTEEMSRISSAVSNLADWFNDRFYGRN